MSTDTLTWDWREQPDLDALAGILARYGVTLEQVDTGTDQYEVRIDGSAPEVTALIEAAQELRDAWQELSAPGLMSPAVRDAAVARTDAAERAVVTAADAFDQPAEVTAHRFVWRPWRVQDGPPDTHTTAGTAQTVPEPPSDEAIAASYLATAHRRVAALEAQVRAVAGLCQHWAGAPEGDRVELREVAQTMRTCIVRAGGEDPLAVWAEPADAPAVEPQGGRTGGNPNPGTPDSGPAILGRALRGHFGVPVLIEDEQGNWGSGFVRPVPRAEAVQRFAAQEVLLVSAVAGRVLEAAQRWRNSPEAWHAARDDDERELIAAVDAMVGDRPVEPDRLDGSWCCETCQRISAAAAPDLAEPAPKPDSVPGWDRKAYDQLLHELRDQHLDGYADQVERVFGALLADRNRLHWVLDTHRPELELRATNQWQSGVIGDLMRERDEARAELAEVTADRNRLSGQIKRLADFIVQNVPGEPSQSQGAVDTAIRLLETFGYLRQERDAARAEVERLRSELAEANGKHGQTAMNLVMADEQSRWNRRAYEEALAKLERLRADLGGLRAEVIRDAQANALEWVAAEGTGLSERQRSDLRGIAAEVRAGTRSIGQPEPATGGEAPGNDG